MNPRDNKTEELVFSLDIGTRTVIGIICKKDRSDSLEVIDYAIREHKKRNMYDGQIHNIDGVADLAREIKEELEERNNIVLKDVSVAAAGRNLKTRKSIVEQGIDRSVPISTFNIETLELEALQRAQKSIEDEDDSQIYYTIGYTVSDYYLDEDRIDRLEGHKGERIGVEILATFLPKIVVEGLYSVIEKVGLRIGTITLEPIAAINIAIEKDLRLLNLALVDIGAGTSDIAITDSGQIVSYDMTQTAGDEITEDIIRNLLLDFPSAEKLKKDLLVRNDHRVKNILGKEITYTTEDVISRIDGSLNKIAENIAKSILENNKKTPDAVFLVGGSSQMLGLKEKIAEKIGIDQERVAIMELLSINRIRGVAEINRPDMITPIGIALEGFENKDRSFINVDFLGKKIRAFDTGRVKVSDILVLENFDPKNLMPSWGEDFIYYKDGSRRVIKGREGTRPEILVNNQLASLQTILSDGDSIRIKKSEVINSEPPSIYDIVSKSIPIENILVNGFGIDEDYLLKKNDSITVITEEDYKNAYKKKENSLNINPLGGVSIIDGEEATILDKELSPKENVEEVVREIGNQEDIKELTDDLVDRVYEDIGDDEIFLLVNGEEMIIKKDKEKFIFVDIFNHIDFDRTVAKGRLCLMINGEEAEYMKELNNGDELEIYWA